MATADGITLFTLHAQILWITMRYNSQFRREAIVMVFKWISPLMNNAQMFSIYGAFTHFDSNRLDYIGDCGWHNIVHFACPNSMDYNATIRSFVVKLLSCFQVEIPFAGQSPLPLFLRRNYTLIPI